MSIFTKIALTLLLLPFSAFAQDQIRIDLDTHWLRRDWDKCRENVIAKYQNNALTIKSDHAAALFWQIPTKNGEALKIDRNQDWIKKCDRPPRDFDSDIRKGNIDRLISIQEYPYISWRWRVSNTIDDTNTANKKGEIQKNGDDFAAKIGISIVNEKEELREIAYLWTRTIPEETALTQTTSLVFGLVKFEWHRIVAQSGNKYLNKWVNETRSIYDDFKRFYPNEEPREIVRIYLMSDSDNTKSTTSGAFADITFHKTPPPHYVKAK